MVMNSEHYFFVDLTVFTIEIDLLPAEFMENDVLWETSMTFSSESEKKHRNFFNSRLL